MPHHDNVIFKSKIKNVKTFKWFFKKKQEHFGCKCSCMYHSANWLCWPVLCPPFADESISSILMFRNWPLFVLNHCGRILHFLGLNKPIVSCSLRNFFFQLVVDRSWMYILDRYKSFTIKVIFSRHTGFRKVRKTEK